MVSKLLTAKLGVAVLVAVVAVGGAAAAAGVAKSASDHARAKAIGKVDKAPSDRGPDATGPAKAGLCRAWASGNGRENGGKESSTAFEALAKAAGGADKVTAFCADVSTEASSNKQGGDKNTDRSEGSSAALDGQCKAWASNKSGDKQQGEAFASLVTAAGGAANVASFCAARAAADQAGQAGGTAGEKRDEQASAGSDHASDRADQNRPATNG